MVISSLFQQYHYFVHQLSELVSNDFLTEKLLKKLNETPVANISHGKQILKTNVWIEYYWTDTKLMWNPVSSFLLRNAEFIYVLIKTKNIDIHVRE